MALVTRSTKGPFSCQLRIVELSIKRCALATTQLRSWITSSCVILAGDLAQVGFEPTTSSLSGWCPTSELPNLPDKMLAEGSVIETLPAIHRSHRLAGEPLDL